MDKLVYRGQHQAGMNSKKIARLSINYSFVRRDNAGMPKSCCFDFYYRQSRSEKPLTGIVERENKIKSIFQTPEKVCMIRFRRWLRE